MRYCLLLNEKKDSSADNTPLPAIFLCDERNPIFKSKTAHYHAARPGKKEPGGANVYTLTVKYYFPFRFWRTRRCTSEKET